MTSTSNRSTDLKPVNRLLLSRKVLVISAVISGLLTASAFPPLSFTFVAWFALTPVLVATSRRQDRGVFWYGSLAGLIYFFLSYIWLASVKPLSYINPLLIALVWAPVVGLWLYWTRKFYWRLVFRNPLSPTLTQEESRYLIKALPSLFYVLGSAGLWCVLEGLRFKLFTGFPWNVLAASQVHYPSVLKLVPFGGMLLVSFFVICSNLILALVVETVWQRRVIVAEKLDCRSTLLVQGALLALLAMAVVLAPKAGHSGDNVKFRAAVIQGGFIPDLTKAPTTEEIDEFIQFYYQSSLESLKENPDLIVWPETGIPAPFRYNKNYYQSVQKLMSKSSVPLLLGSSDYRKSDGQSMDGYNSAFLINTDGTIRDTYDKIHLVPYGEYTPFKGLIPDGWHRALNEFSGMGPGLQAGQAYTVFHLDEKVRFGVNICFEDVFPKISREFAKRDANLLVTLTNDAWFLKTTGGEQHLYHGLFRSLETGLPTLRCGNWSDSCLVNSDGRVEQLLTNNEGSRFSRGWRIIEVDVPLKPQLTFYQRYPNAFIYFCSFLAFGMLAYLMFLFYKKKQGLLALMASEEL